MKKQFAEEITDYINEKLDQITGGSEDSPVYLEESSILLIAKDKEDTKVFMYGGGEDIIKSLFIGMDGSEDLLQIMKHSIDMYLKYKEYEHTH